MNAEFKQQHTDLKFLSERSLWDDSPESIKTHIANAPVPPQYWTTVLIMNMMRTEPANFAKKYLAKLRPRFQVFEN